MLASWRNILRALLARFAMGLAAMGLGLFELQIRPTADDSSGWPESDDISYLQHVGIRFPQIA